MRAGVVRRAFTSVILGDGLSLMCLEENAPVVLASSPNSINTEASAFNSDHRLRFLEYAPVYAPLTPSADTALLVYNALPTSIQSQRLRDVSYRRQGTVASFEWVYTPRQTRRRFHY